MFVWSTVLHRMPRCRRSALFGCGDCWQQTKRLCLPWNAIAPFHDNVTVFRCQAIKQRTLFRRLVFASFVGALQATYISDASGKP